MGYKLIIYQFLLKIIQYTNNVKANNVKSKQNLMWSIIIFTPYRLMSGVKIIFNASKKMNF